MNDIQKNPGTANELFGAVVDSFTRDRTERLTRLEDRLAWLNRWAIIVVVFAFAYFGYQLWGELGLELVNHQTEAEQAPAAYMRDEAYTSIFIIFAAALGGPVVLVAGYLILGFIYNLLCDALIHRIPLTRFFIVPVLLLSGLMFLESRRVELKESLLAVYDAAAARIASAKALQQQAKAAGEKLHELREMEAQLHALDDDGQVGGETRAASRQIVRGTITPQGKDGAVAQDDAVRQLGEVMLQLQGLSTPQPPQAESQAAHELQPGVPAAENIPLPAAKGTTATPAAPAGI